jgi:hypothetical protein
MYSRERHTESMSWSPHRNCPEASKAVEYAVSRNGILRIRSDSESQSPASCAYDMYRPLTWIVDTLDKNPSKAIKTEKKNRHNQGGLP